jgi:hypothetical protein
MPSLLAASLAPIHVPSQCPREYQCNLGPDGRRQDYLERPELHKGSVEYVAPEEYMVRPPMPPVRSITQEACLSHTWGTQSSESMFSLDSGLTLFIKMSIGQSKTLKLIELVNQEP